MKSKNIWSHLKAGLGLVDNSCYLFYYMTVGIGYFMYKIS